MMNSMLLLCIAIFGAVFTSILSIELKQGAVRASALGSLGVALYFHFFPLVSSSYLTQNIPLIYFGSSFVGMVSPIIHPNRAQIAISAFIYSIIYLNTEGVFMKYGGRLGASAFIAISFTYGFQIALKRFKLFQYFKK